ncbi:conserved hypothetical protein [Haliangium ochraceum DSM 14365]|uniref:Serine protease n=2 Tax=Haliangium ochraceum TaxID=80816 RepID=D0LNU5_HALO1|nr:conserved hypothetical protein [Haliangium ochraceum DSM 14365]
MRSIIPTRKEGPRRISLGFGAGMCINASLLCALALGGCVIDGELAYDDQFAGDELFDDVEQVQDEVVYGSDDRLDVYAHGDGTLQARAAEATVALMNPSDYDDSDPQNLSFPGSSLGDARNLCSTERFLDDPTAAFCSGTLIDDDLVLTAGHCITSSSACNNTRFVFNYYRDGADSLQTVTSEDVFACTSIVARQQGTVSGQNLDYAIVRIDRPATPRFTPAPVRAVNEPLASGQGVAVIGCGSGIPFKIDDGGSVRDPRSSVLDYFVATTDTFGGNSGSGVYELDGYTVAGILVRGETDYVSNGSCTIVNDCSENGCGGEDITYVYPAIEHYCSVATSDRLCGSLPPPPPPPENSFDYSATNTNSAQQNTVNEAIVLEDGDSITFGTCGLTGSSFTGDTYLRLFQNGVEVSSNDDSCGGLGSQVSFTVPAGAGGSYEMRGGCYSSGSCTGRVVYEVIPGDGGGPGEPGSGAFAFSTSNTNNATQNTVDHDVTLAAGETIEFGTCTVPGSSGSGDTYLRLYFNGGQVAENDDSSGCGRLSFASHTAGASGTFQIRAGCYKNRSCSGTVAYEIQ